MLPASEFIRAALAKSGATTATEFARALGLEGYNARQRAERWMEAKNGPNYEGTMTILEYLGWLNVGGRGEAEQPPSSTVGSTADERWRDQVDRQLEQQAETLRELQVMVREIHERLR